MKSNAQLKKIIADKTVPASTFFGDTSAAERKIIEAEKKYYQIIVALKEKRKKLGLTQEKLALLSNVPRTTITKVESGERNATLQTIIAMAQAMGKNVELRLV